MDVFLTIGLEIHTELLTKTKMFSSSPLRDDALPNTLINEIDLALPGTLPSVNKKAVILGITLAKYLNMNVENFLAFDRKNYFYLDLPKGYQITQQYYPIGRNGKIVISNKTINIERIHLEEDTAKKISNGEEVWLDYNRAGVPLIEIVTKPDFNTKEECVEFLNKLKRILTFLEISDGKMENGSLRVDLNISVSTDKNTLGKKVEVKNINSFYNVAKAIDFEYNRQKEIVLNQQTVSQETRRWDDSTNSTISMRTKNDAIDYRYITEPNIVACDIANLINQTEVSEANKPECVESFLNAQGVNPTIIQQLLDNYSLYKVFKYVCEKTNDYNAATTWIVVELMKLINEDGKTIETIPYSTIDFISDMILMIKNNEINGKQAKQIIVEIYQKNISPQKIVSENGLAQITDKNVIKELYLKIFEQNPAMVEQCKVRPDRTEKFFIGMLMKETKGQANPQLANEVLRELMSNLN